MLYRSRGEEMKKHLLLALLLAVSPAVAQGQADPAANPDNGKLLFDTFGCASCHGGEGQGSRDGPRLNPAPPFEPMLLQLRQPRDLMPRYQASLLSDQDVADIHAYISRFPPGEDPKTIRLLTEN